MGIVGVDGSPSCGVNIRLDLGRSFAALSGLGLENLDRETMNRCGVADCLVEGEGWFVEALEGTLCREELEVAFQAHDLMAEMQEGARWRW